MEEQTPQTPVPPPTRSGLIARMQSHKKWLIPTAVATIAVFLLFSVAAHLQHRRHLAQQESVAEDSASPIPHGKGPGAARQPTVVDTDATLVFPKGMIPGDEAGVYSATPTPSEIIGKIEAADTYSRQDVEKKLSETRVVWPLYVFSITPNQQNGTAKLMLDASEDGFGVIISTEINPLKFQDIFEARKGDKVWLAGKIVRIDTQGTGQITLLTEYAAVDNRKIAQ